ncbi:MAG TPA: UbiA family prenyltransferase [Flavisolibacter sp.]|nr:UbiA family prenyltransferase [Flavisolibacter sp.]
MLQQSTIQLLRFHFSFFLVPVYLFAVSQAEELSISRALVIFIILHVLVYPASNGYNSFMDRDETAIGGLKNPPQPTKELFYTTIVMDLLALVASLLISGLFFVCILLYIIASRAYSYRPIRLKKYPVIGFLTVFIFQGAVIYFATYNGIQPNDSPAIPVLPSIISSCLIGALYPLTQIYQHIEDKKDGVTTISYILGKRGTFLFSAAFFIMTAFLFYQLFDRAAEIKNLVIFMIIMSPVVLFFLYWMCRVLLHEHEANFENSLRMNVLSTFCTTVFFIILILKKY